MALVRGSVLSISQFAVAYLSGILVGDLGCYFLGYFLSRFWPQTQRRFSRARLQERIGGLPIGTLLLVARFTPAIKMPVFVYSGWIRYPLHRYISWLLGLTLVQVSVVGCLLSLHLPVPPTWFGILKNTLLIYLAIFVLFRVLIFCIVHREQLRLHLRAKFFWWLRYHNRQFWPLWLVYLPLYFYLPLLGLKYRSLWAWLYVNPGLPNGGWWNEKKSAMDVILRKYAVDYYLPGQALDPSEFSTLRLDGFSYPLVAKPDQGKQGQGVHVAHNAEELSEIIKASDKTLFLQQYDSSPGEAGLMFFRNPQTGRIELFSITDKIFPVVTADGASNVFELILHDKRARFIAPTYLAQCRVPLTEILPRGRRFALTHLGNHSKGALFFSGDALKSRALEDHLNLLLGEARGIDFGRFDVKYISRQKLMEGEFKIIELNGAGAESTNIHDPKFSLVEVYRILFRQWDLLFRLGKPHEKSFGHSVSKLFRM